MFASSRLKRRRRRREHPAAINFLTVSGVAATRLSLSWVSFGMPICMVILSANIFLCRELLSNNFYFRAVPAEGVPITQFYNGFSCCIELFYHPMICPNCRKPFYFLTRPSPGKARCHRCGFSGEASTH